MSGEKEPRYSNTAPFGHVYDTEADECPDNWEITRRLNALTEERDALTEKYRMSLNDCEYLAARIEELEVALPDPDKLDLLARLFDKVDEGTERSDEIQRDLREWAYETRNVLSKGDKK